MQQLSASPIRPRAARRAASTDLSAVVRDRTGGAHHRLRGTSTRRESAAQDGGHGRLAMHRDDSGFSLIELLVVVIIIGILAAVAVPIYLSAQNNGKDASVVSDVASARIAVMSLDAKSNSFPTSRDDLGQTTGISAAGFTQGKDLAGPITYSAPVSSATADFCIAALSITGTYVFATNAVGVIKTTDLAGLPASCATPTPGSLADPK